MRLLWGLILAAALAATAAATAPYRAPRTAFGAPDFQGVWTNSSLTFLQRLPFSKGLIGTPQDEARLVGNFKKMFGDLISDAPIDPNLPAPPVVKAAPQVDLVEIDMRLARVGGQIRTSYIVDPEDGRIPFTEAGKQAVKDANRETFDGPEGRPTSERCLTAVGSPEGPPMMNTGFNANYQFVETRDHVAILIEMNHDVRIVRLTDRAHAPAALRRWMGDSVGWWEGDTLVVETTNFNPKGTSIGTLGGGFVYSPNAKLTERFTRTAKDELLYEFAVDDPVNFSKVWKAQMPMRPSRGPIYEYACHEGNYSEANALSGARAQEREAATAAPAPSAGRP